MKKELGCPFKLGEYEEMKTMKKTCSGNCGCNGKCGGNCKCSGETKNINVYVAAVDAMPSCLSEDETKISDDVSINKLDINKLTIDQRKLVSEYASHFGCNVDQISIELPYVSNQTGPAIMLLPNIMMRTPDNRLIELPIRVEDTI